MATKNDHWNKVVDSLTEHLVIGPSIAGGLGVELYLEDRAQVVSSEDAHVALAIAKTKFPKAGEWTIHQHSSAQWILQCMYDKEPSKPKSNL